MNQGIRIVMGAVVAAGVVAAGGANAGFLSLGSLIANGGTVTVGDKLFSDFTYAATGDMPDASNIAVLGNIDAGNFGLIFTGNFQDLAGGGASDALITFEVTVLDPSMQISGATLSGDPSINGGNPNSFGSLTETFLTGNSTDTMTIFDSAVGTQLTDSVTFAQPVSTLSVQKDILLFADNNDTVTLTTIEQTFPQVPEPGSLALMGLGAVALLRRRR